MTGWALLEMPMIADCTTSRMELITVITPTYRSPPHVCSVALHTICTALPERQLVRALLALKQGAHPGGRHLPQQGGRRGGVLSEREAEVMALIVRGFINKEIADRLNIGLATVVTHRKNMMEKLGVRSVSALTIYAVVNGYVGIDSI